MVETRKLLLAPGPCFETTGFVDWLIINQEVEAIAAANAIAMTIHGTCTVSIFMLVQNCLQKVANLPKQSVALPPDK